MWLKYILRGYKLIGKTNLIFKYNDCIYYLGSLTDLAIEES